ncbi:MAG: carboxypeptidase-like regulatory domain-containing protein [Candidatus Acidiferrales bacterium]
MHTSSRYERFVYSIFGFALVVALAVGTSSRVAWSQSTSTGTITGEVTDTSNAIVPGATVSITLRTTGGVRTTTTDNEGRYVFADVDPGAYNIQVTKQGFASTVISNQVVQIGTQLTENVKLQLGSISQTVTVTENPGAELQTMTPTVGTTLSGAIIMNLPNVSRDASSLATLQPGQNINGNTGGVAGDQNSFQLDGGYATDDMSGDNNTYIASFSSDTAGGSGAMHSPVGNSQAPSAVVPIPVSSIEEFKVSTANQTADFNGGAGSQMELVTKRGTNTIHGGAYEYYQDTNFAGANTWDNNSTGFAQPSAHFSRFGADAGGKIPKINFLGGAWYIFGNYEGFRYPNSSSFELDYPLPSLRAGLVHLNGDTINLNPFPVTDPGCGTATNGCEVTAANGYTPGAVIPTTICPSGPCDPRGLGTTTNGASGGPLNPVIQLWTTYLPLPNDCTQGDSLNYCGYKSTISTPESSNFGVMRIDHDFAKSWHFNATYHYYKLNNTVSNQVDVGGFFPGDTFGQYAAIRQKPQEPWLYTAGLTTNVSSNVTNDFHYSFTRNYWAYGDPSGVPNVAGYPAALEIGGEQQDSFQPYNTNNQNVRTRYWNGHDSMYRDDVTWIRGNHLFQLGGLYQRNNDTHNRNDNGQTINTYEQYIIGGGNGASLAGYGINMAGYDPANIVGSEYQGEYENLYSMVLGMVDETQSLYTRSPGSLETGLPLNPRTSCAISGIAATADCISSPPLTNDSIIPTYNVYLTDAWHIKPTFSLNYGLGYTIEMPPFNTNGGYQTVMVDQDDHILSTPAYLNSVKQAALQGNAYAPYLGFAIVDDVQDHSKYPYNPFYGGLSPRVGFAWNLRPDTVIRGGYSRIFGRINGVNPILVPMLTPGLMQPDTCGGPNITTGGCGGTTPLNDFRVGVDCPASGPCVAPLPPPVADLPQPWYPGVNSTATGSGETIDPNFHPNRSDEFTLSVQHQFGPKILAEVGYIGRILSNEVQYYSLTAVPYMMTRGGQSFANAWANVMVATNYGTNLTNIPVQPFFENALGMASSPYCTGALTPGLYTGATSCTQAFVENSAVLMNKSDAFDAYTDASNLGAFVYGRSMTSDPIAATCTAGAGIGCSGQSPSIVSTVSNGYGNYNAGYIQLTTTAWHGLTAKTNFSYSNALGTGDVVQATSSFASVDPWNIQNNYGPQTYNEKFTLNAFLNYAEPFYASQQGIIGRLLGGWNFSPLFVYGSGFPVEMNTSNGDCGSFGQCNTNYIGSLENMVITKNLNYSGTEKQAVGTECGFAGPGYNVFSNPDATCPVNGGIFGDPVRNPILGYDGQIGGGGPVKGLPFFNLDLGITKNIRLKERFSSSLYFDWTNVLNHMQPNDPCFFSTATYVWGVLGCGGNLQGNTPRRLQLGMSLDW